MNKGQDSQNRYAAIVQMLAPGADARVDEDARTGKAFGADALKINNRIFAMLSSRNQFVVKLPRARVDELIATGDGERFDPGHGRLMKEWFAVSPDSEIDWLVLAREARAFVSEIPSHKRPSAETDQ